MTFIGITVLPHVKYNSISIPGSRISSSFIFHIKTHFKLWTPMIQIPIDRVCFICANIFLLMQLDFHTKNDVFFNWISMIGASRPNGPHFKSQIPCITMGVTIVTLVLCLYLHLHIQSVLSHEKLNVQFPTEARWTQ